jgi:hypothetical protein
VSVGSRRPWSWQHLAEGSACCLITTAPCAPGHSRGGRRATGWRSPRSDPLAPSTRNASTTNHPHRRHG